ncbi:MAG: hypothetical protein KAZ88_13865, partial [Acidimicrobiia bacterium]|nr:hypothetical protein [Acidimicrobiia bacterium]
AAPDHVASGRREPARRVLCEVAAMSGSAVMAWAKCAAYSTSAETTPSTRKIQNVWRHYEWSLCKLRPAGMGGYGGANGGRFAP